MADSTGAQILKKVLAAYSPDPEDFDVVAVATEHPYLRNNAAADTCPDARRYIFYDPRFVAGFACGESKEWGKYALFAHEIAHHVLNHFLIGRHNTSPPEQKKFELAADRLAGFILAQLGAGGNDAISSISAMATAEETDTHPGLCRRRAAFMDGYNKAASRLGRPTHSQPAEGCAPAAKVSGTPGPGPPVLPRRTPAPAPQWTDRGEYDLFDAVSNERNTQRKIVLLDRWASLYPNSRMRAYRRGLYVDTYAASGQVSKLLEQVEQLLLEEPENVQALWWMCYLGPALGRKGDAELRAVHQAGARLLAVEITGPPSGVSPDAWSSAVTELRARASKALGWVAMHRQQKAEALGHFRRSLQDDPRQPEVSYWMGLTITGDKDVATYATGLYHVGRAVAYDGPNKLSEAAIRSIDDWLTRAYRGFHGSEGGLAELKAFAKTAALPPENFTLASATAVYEARQKELEQLKKTNPQLALWTRVRDMLLEPDGEAYFESSVKGALLPPLRARVLRRAGKEIVAAISDSSTEEVVLRADTQPDAAIRPGTDIEFRGVGASYTRSPFRVFFDAEAKEVRAVNPPKN